MTITHRFSAFPLLVLWCVAAVCSPTARGADAEDLAAQLAAAPQLQTEDLGEPVKSVRQGMLLSAPNPDGKTWDLLQIYFPKYGGPNTIVIIDLGSEEVKQVQTETGWNFHLCPTVVAPNSKLFISVLDQRLRQKVCIYDPATNDLQLGAVPMPEQLLGETHPLVLGTDGKLYAIGQHPSKAAAAARIDPDTLEVTFYGPIGPSHAPNACWGYSGGADERFIYIASGKIPWYLVAFDRQTGASQTLVETATVEGWVGVGQRFDGCTANARNVVGTDGKKVNFWLHEGRLVPQRSPNEIPPWPRRSPPRSWPREPQVDLSRAVPDVNGDAEIRAFSPRSVSEIETDPSPDELGWKSFRFRVPVYPHSIYRLTELPDGRLFGTAGAYEGNFVYDPATGNSEHLGKTELSHYATTISDGKLYMSGYPTSPLYVFDPAKPWTTGKLVGGRVVADDDPQANPRRLLLMGAKEMAGTHKMYAAATGADGRVYFGGQWIRDGACGGLAWYDPKTGQAGGAWRPLSTYQVTHMAAADQGRTIVLSTRAVGDAVLKNPRPEQGAIFFVDTARAELSAPFEPVAGVRATGHLAAAGGSRVVAWTEQPANPRESLIYGVDVRGPKVTATRTLPHPLPVGLGSNQQEAWDFRLGPDGKIWTFLAGALVRINPADLSLEVVGKLTSSGRIAFADGAVYLGGETSLRRIKGLAVATTGSAATE